MEDRLANNLEILRQLTHYIKQNPDQRFGQVLRNMGIVVDYSDAYDGCTKWANHFNEEPSKMLARIKERKKK